MLLVLLRTNIKTSIADLSVTYGLLQVVGNNYQRKLLEIIDARYIFFAGSEFQVVMQCVSLLARMGVCFYWLGWVRLRAPVAVIWSQSICLRFFISNT